MEFDELTLKFVASAYNKTPHYVDEHQMQWCREHIDPMLPDLQRVVELVREEVDRTVGKKNLEADTDDEFVPGMKHPWNYPEGHCAEVAEGIYIRLRRLMKTDDDLAIAMLRDAKRANIPFTPVYGILQATDGRIFQNAIQLGDKIIDGAFDTGRGRNVRKVFIWERDDGIFSPIISYTDFAAVAESYYKVRAYPTFQSFPYLAPFFPGISVSPTSKISFLHFHDLYFRNICMDFKLSKKFTRDSLYASRALPPRVRQYFARRFSGRDDMLRFCDRGVKLEDVFTPYVNRFGGILNGLPPGVKQTRYQEFTTLLQTIEQVERCIQYEFLYR